MQVPEHLKGHWPFNLDRESRSTLIVIACFAWMPGWMILGLITAKSFDARAFAMVGVFIAVAPLAIWTFWFLGVLLHSLFVERDEQGWIIVIFILITWATWYANSN